MLEIVVSVAGNRFDAYSAFEPTQTSPIPLNEHPEAFVNCKLSMGITEQRSTGQHVIDDHPPHAPDLFKPAGHRRRSDIRHALVVREGFVQMFTWVGLFSRRESFRTVTSLEGSCRE